MNLCAHCRYRPARPNKQHPHLLTLYCSDRCKDAAQRARRNERDTDLANEVRRMLGLPDERSRYFTTPELQAIVRRLRRVLPYDGMAMHPARHRRAS